MTKLLKLKSSKFNQINTKGIIALIILFCIYAFPQNTLAKDFEGEIIFEIKYEDGIEKPILESLPKKSSLLIKNQKFLSATESPLGKQGLIYDHKKGLSYTLTDFFKKALAIKKNKALILTDREQFKVIRIKHTDITKKILGHNCKKIVLTVFIPKINQNVDFEAFYTLDLGNINWINEADPIYHQVKGMLLEYQIQMGSVFMEMKAKKINPRKINENEFKIPRSYTIVTPEEAQKLLRSGK